MRARSEFPLLLDGAESRIPIHITLALLDPLSIAQTLASGIPKEFQ